MWRIETFGGYESRPYSLSAWLRQASEVIRAHRMFCMANGPPEAIRSDRMLSLAQASLGSYESRPYALCSLCELRKL